MRAWCLRRCARTFSAVSRLDAAERDGRRWFAGAREDGIADRRKRVVVAGSGPLLLAVAAYLRGTWRGGFVDCRAGVVVQLHAVWFGLLK
jgi:hypothetical protein